MDRRISRVHVSDSLEYAAPRRAVVEDTKAFCRAVGRRNAANAVSPFKGGPALIITYYSFAPLCAASNGRESRSYEFFAACIRRLSVIRLRISRRVT